MTIKTIRQLMRQSVFVGKDGVVEHQNAFVEILAYYEIVKSLLVKTPKYMAVVRENMEKARILAKVNGFSYVEIKKEAKELAARTMIRAQARGLLKAA